MRFFLGSPQQGGTPALVYGKNPEKQNPELDKIPNWTKSRIRQNPQWTKSGIGQNPALDKNPNGKNPELNKIQNRTNFQDRESQD